MRPHQALGGKTPSDVYKPVERNKPVKISPIYPRHFDVLNVSKDGVVSYNGSPHFISTPLSKQEIGLERLDACRVRLWFHDIDLGILEVAPSLDNSTFAQLVTESTPKKWPGVNDSSLLQH